MHRKCPEHRMKRHSECSKYSGACDVFVHQKSSQRPQNTSLSSSLFTATFNKITVMNTALRDGCQVTVSMPTGYVSRCTGRWRHAGEKERRVCSRVCDISSEIRSGFSFSIFSKYFPFYKHEKIINDNRKTSKKCITVLPALPVLCCQ